MDMAAVMDGAITADAGIITGGVEAVATTMVGGIIAITGDFITKSPGGTGHGSHDAHSTCLSSGRFERLGWVGRLRETHHLRKRQSDGIAAPLILCGANRPSRSGDSNPDNIEGRSHSKELERHRGELHSRSHHHSMDSSRRHNTELR